MSKTLSFLALMLTVSTLFSIPAAATVLADSTNLSVEETEEDEIWKAESIEAQINLMEDTPDKHLIPQLRIVEIHEEYDALSDAAKTHVKNYDYLLEIEALLKIQYVPKEAREREQKFGTAYNVPITDETPKISLVIRYLTDKDGDEVLDAPSLVLSSPSGTSYPINGGMKAFETDTLKLAVTWNEKYMQIDFSEAEKGSWLVMSDCEVYFNLIEYAGSIYLPTFVEETESVEETTAKPKTEPAVTEDGITFMDILTPILWIAGLVAVFVIIRVVMKKLKNRTKMQPEEDSEEEDPQEDGGKIDEEEEMRRMREFLMRNSGNDAVEDAESKETKTETREVKRDDGEDYEEVVDYPSGITDEKEADDSGFGSRF